VPPPAGFVRRSSGEVALDPDKQVEAVIRLIFGLFDRLGTVGAVLAFLADNHIQLGIRVREGPERGELAWRRPSRATLRNIFRNPACAGIYAYGRSRVDPRRRQAGRPFTGRASGLRTLQQEDDRPLPARPRRETAPGLCVHPRQERLRRRQWQQLAGPCVDAHVADLLLAAMAPAALEVSLAAAEQAGPSARVEVDVEGTCAGGHRTSAQITRPVACLTQLSYYSQLAARGQHNRRPWLKSGSPHRHRTRRTLQ
jgi:recombinase